MITDPPEPAIQLNVLVEAIAEAEAAHIPNIPLREDFQHVPVGCSCGERFAEPGWPAGRRHMREVIARAVMRALHRPCETCHGSGQWRKMAGLLICPDCDGRGKVLTPLPPMVFQDERGYIWHVEEDLAGHEDEVVRARVWREP